MTGRPVTSDLTIDEALVLHSVGWEPLDLVCGASIFSVPVGFWNWGNGEIQPASLAWQRAVGQAARNLQDECRQAGGHGVVGVHIDVSIEAHWVNAVLMGTAVTPVGGARPPAHPFVSDLDGRDFALLHTAGWQPVGLAFGAAFVFAPRRTMGTALSQANQNVELTNYTEALYAARESAMERMQSVALQLQAQGVVDVTFQEGPMGFAPHAIAFTTWGTAVRVGAEGHRQIRPQVAVLLDDKVLQFSAESLRGA